MKKLVLVLVALFTLSLSNSAQEVKQQGKTFEVTKKEKVKSEPKDTGYTITINGITYPIYKGERGGYYYIIVVNGEKKKKYVPAEVKRKLKEAGV